jgi:hypothetical protein
MWTFFRLHLETSLVPRRRGRHHLLAWEGINIYGLNHNDVKDVLLFKVFIRGSGASRPWDGWSHHASPYRSDSPWGTKEKQVAQDWLAVTRGDFDEVSEAFAGYFHPDATWTLIGSTPISGTYHGLESIQNDVLGANLRVRTGKARRRRLPPRGAVAVLHADQSGGLHRFKVPPTPKGIFGNPAEEGA